jgi:hypothetical protein
MKTFVTKLTAIAATSAALSIAVSINAPKADAAMFNLNWQGSGGYSATGSLSFDDALQGQLITKNELDSLNISFFDASNTLLQSFNYANPASDTEFNFNFNSATGTILQSGAGASATGFDLGINYNAGQTGLDFYTAAGAATYPLGTIILEDNLAPQGCALDAPPGLCNVLSTGGTLVATVATAVPEPTSVLGLLALGAIGAGSAFKKKLASNQAAKSTSLVS